MLWVMGVNDFAILSGVVVLQGDGSANMFNAFFTLFMFNAGHKMIMLV